MSDWNSYQKKYLESEPSVKAIIDSTTIPECVQNTISLGLIAPALKKTLIRVFSDHTLGILSKESLIEECVKLGISTPESIYASIRSCIIETKNHTDSLPLTESEFTSSTSSGGLSSDIAQTEAALAHVSTVRTMARDMEDLKSQAPSEPPVYQSTQPSVLRPAGPGKAPTSAPARWGSESS